MQNTKHNKMIKIQSMNEKLSNGKAENKEYAIK